jgi:dihydropteroate synthase
LVFDRIFDGLLSKINEHCMQKVYTCGGKELDLSHPVVMGILNITPDSFYDGGSFLTMKDQLEHAEKMLSEGAMIIDIGAVSTRPGARVPDEKEETERLLPTLKALVKQFPEAIYSVDTFRSEVARIAIDNGAGMINDIYGGRFDERMVDVIRSAGVPYVIMHMQGDPDNMQIMPYYEDVAGEIMEFFRIRTAKFTETNAQLILDPGFGFGKSVEHNYRILDEFETFKSPGYPLMAGLSRKSMINRILHTRPAGALNGTTVLNTIALLKGADILRVHDVKEAVEAIKLVEALKGHT